MAEFDTYYPVYRGLAPTPSSESEALRKRFEAWQERRRQEHYASSRSVSDELADIHRRLDAISHARAPEPRARVRKATKRKAIKQAIKSDPEVQGWKAASKVLKELDEGGGAPPGVAPFDIAYAAYAEHGRLSYEQFGARILEIRDMHRRAGP